MKQLKTILQLLSDKVTDEDLDPLLSKWTHHKTLKRFEHLSEEGSIENMLYFITKGTFQTYIFNKDNREVETFGFPNNLYCSYVSFLTQQPAKNNLQALTKAEVIGIKKADFFYAIDKNWNLERIWRRQTEHLIVQRVERALLLRSESKEKVRVLLEKRPDFFQHVPHKYIASFLHMSPATLSRVLKTL